MESTTDYFVPSIYLVGQFSLSIRDTWPKIHAA